MRAKFSKREFIISFEEIIRTEWCNLTYDEVRKKIFELTHIDLTNADVGSACRRMGIDRSAPESERRKKARINFNPWFKR